MRTLFGAGFTKGVVFGWLVRLALIAAAALVGVAGAALLLLQDGAPIEHVEEGPVWAMGASYFAQGVACGSCHYGELDFWRADWTEDGGSWNLTVSPFYPDISISAVQAVLHDPVIAHTPEMQFEWDQGSTWETAIDVPEGAGGILAKVYGQPWRSPDDIAPVQMQPNDYITALELVSPNGTVYPAIGPEDDLKLLVVAEPIAGTWTMRATLIGGDLPRALGVPVMQVLAGKVEPFMNDIKQQAVWNFPSGGDGAPPEVTLRLWPHYNHQAYEHADWDIYDAVAHLVRFKPQLEPLAGEKTWNQTEINEIWGSQAEYLFLDRTGSRIGAYFDEEGHNDAGFGGSYPSFGSLGSPVWPGTREVRIEMTWTPAIERPDLEIRFSPSNTPYFYEAQLVDQSAGAATFTIAVRDSWWEDPHQGPSGHAHGDEDGDGPVGYWDIAPAVTGADGSLKVETMNWSMQAYAMR